MLRDKTILVTGGTGSFGQEFARIVLRDYSPHALRIYSRGEFLQSEMAQKFNDDRLRFFIGDVRDRDRLRRAMEGVDIVVHAAALKQVPAVEYNPIEAVHTNITGAVNVVDAALDKGVGRVLAIGTDKEVHPVNLYGATKLVAEKLFVQANSYATHSTMFSCSRYGNVVGSRGSVIPLFKKQKREGRLTVTDERMTRFWLSLEQGVRFIIGCIERMRGGEVFVPKIPSARVMDVAEAVAPGVPTAVTGIRPGEKLHELLIAPEDSRRTLEFGDYFVITPDFPFWRVDDTVEYGGEAGIPCPDGFQYGSDINREWLSAERLRTMIQEAA
ncbi:MAG: UDP-N-acetylglucosamine 4,6-dehydratase (inverting) [Dehalococcoidales bacterium]|nr:UDP-N-acetylglucosamine 4,6-dehydratase (inverting) [Dehalococcoidales bacterium]